MAFYLIPSILKNDLLKRKPNETSVKRNKTKASVIVHLETTPFRALLWGSSAEHWAQPEVVTDHQRKWPNVSSGGHFCSLSGHCIWKDDGNWVPSNTTLPFLFGAGFGWGLDGTRRHWLPSKAGGSERGIQRLGPDTPGFAFQLQHLLAEWLGTRDLTFLVFGYTTVRSGTSLKRCEEQANSIRKWLHKWKILHEY